MANDKMPFTIIVVGGGIAGLAAAIALRGPNRHITVLEKSSMSREVGALISLQPNAQKIVHRMNIRPYLEKIPPTVDEAFRILDTAGEMRMQIPLPESKYGAPRLCYHRQDLHAGLRAAALAEDLPGQPVKIVTAARVVRCDCETGTVELEDGTTYQGDLVVGADGIHSVIRESVLGTTQYQPKPTGVSAYRLLVETSTIPPLDVSPEIFDTQRSVTSLMMGFDRRVIMGPARSGQILGLVCMVPDERMQEDSSDNSWTSPGSMDKLLDMYKDFPHWIRQIFKQAPDIALWQLRDLDALPRWVNGRTIIIGDAAHAMLPTQGQGASQSIEDAEALQAFFADIDGAPTAEIVRERLDKVYRARYNRASLIQAYSRQQASNATTEKGSKVITLNPAEFMDYNCNYGGAVAWLDAHGSKHQLR